MGCFPFFPNFWFTCQDIFQIKKKCVQFSNKRAKSSKLAQKWWLSSILLRPKGAIIACLLNIQHALLTFLLLTVYHLFIRHYIFKDLCGKNVWNLGYGGNLDIFRFWGNSYSRGRGLLGETDGVEDTIVIYL